MISFEDFRKVELKTGKILAADGEKPIPLTTSEDIETGAKIR